MEQLIVEQKQLVTVTPGELAELFCSMDEIEMALFFNTVATEVKKWNAPFCFQLDMVTRNSLLSDDGRKIMKEIGEYSSREIF